MYVPYSILIHNKYIIRYLKILGNICNAIHYRFKHERVHLATSYLNLDLSHMSDIPILIEESGIFSIPTLPS